MRLERLQGWVVHAGSYGTCTVVKGRKISGTITAASGCLKMLKL